jgi:hypothetical protein
VDALNDHNLRPSLAVRRSWYSEAVLMFDDV